MSPAIAEKKSIIKIESLYKNFQGDFGEVRALENINLEVSDGEFICLMGPSGCGKSTLIFIISSLLSHDTGRVLINGTEPINPGADRAVVFQSDAVFPWMTVRQNISYGLKVAGKSKKEIEDTVSYFINLVHLEGFEDAWPKQLSGGMRKRVDLARAYANDPAILLMDEPFGALDILTKEQLQLELQRLWIQKPKTIMFVTHDIEEALFLGDRVIIMSPRPGKIDYIQNIEFERPRPIGLKTSDEFVKLRKKMIDHFQDHT
jgi:NitT/TauT family transport system ATP-binding protein